MDCSTLGFPFPHHLPEFAQVHIHWIGDAIQSSHPLSPLILPSIFASIKVFSSESAVCIRWLKYWSFSFSISPSPGKNTGVGCHFLLQRMKMKSESEVAQSCPTLWDPMDFSLSGSSVHGIFQARVLEWVAILILSHVNSWNLGTGPEGQSLGNPGFHCRSKMFSQLLEAVV